MTKGDLVWVLWPEEGKLFNRVITHRPGIVIDYRPEVYGGSSMYTSRWEEGQCAQIEVATTERRGEALVQLLDGQGVSWFDESNILLTLSGAQGT